MSDQAARQQEINRAYGSAMMLIPKLLPDKFTTAGIDDLYIRMGGDKAWLEKGYPRMWENAKSHRVRQWMEAINKHHPERTFPVALEVLTVLADTATGYPAQERQVARELAKKIEVLMGQAPEPNPHYWDPRLVNVVRDAYMARSFTEVVRRAYVEVINEVKQKAETPSLDGVPLMNKVFSKDKPILKVSDDPDQQEGAMNLFKGAVSMFRNPPSHSNAVIVDQHRADELLWFATYLLRILDSSVKVDPGPASTV